MLLDTENMAGRILYIDTPVPPKDGYKTYTIKTAEEAREFVSEVLGTSFPVYLDIQGCSSKVFGILLSFLDEFKESVDMIADDPVPLTILSRFRVLQISTVFPEEFYVLESLRWKFQPVSIRTRMNNLYNNVPKGD